MNILSVPVTKPEDVNVIIGQSHFIKTVEDLYEAVVCASPSIKFGVAFCEASGACKVRAEGNDPELKELAVKNALAAGAGHSFFIMIRGGFPINVLNQVKAVGEVCTVFAASANPVELVVADNGSGRGILGVIGGSKPKGLEDEKDIQWRKDLLRKIGYKK